VSGIAEARELLAAAIAAEPGAVPENARIGEFERWDSLAHLRLILALEKRIGRTLDPDEAVRIESIEDLAGFLSGRG